MEGYEYEILRSFPFDKYTFACMGIERPTPELVTLLRANGYVPRVRLGEDIFFTPVPVSAPGSLYRQFN